MAAALGGIHLIADLGSSSIGARAHYFRSFRPVLPVFKTTDVFNFLH